MTTETKRSFILLRPLEPIGSRSGYVRLEATGGQLRLTCAVQGFTGAAAYALLLGSGGPVVLGRLRLDARGQGGFQFLGAPGDIGGMPFFDYSILAVGRDLESAFSIDLVGSLRRGGWIDFACAEKQVFALLHPQEAEPEPPAPEPAPVEPPTNVPTGGAENEQPAAVTAETAPEQSTEEPVPSVAEIDAEPDLPSTTAAVDKAPAQAECTTPAAEEPSEEAEPPSAEQAEPPAAEQESGDPDADVLSRIEEAAARFVEKESSIPLPLRLERAFWPQSLWPLRDLFQRFAQDTGFDREDALFVRVPFAGAEYDHILLGVRLDGSWVTAAGYCAPEADGKAPFGFDQGERIAGQDGRIYYCLWEDA